MCKTVGASAIIFHVCLCRPAIVPTENIQILCFLCHIVRILLKRYESKVVARKLILLGCLCGDGADQRVERERTDRYVDRMI